VISSDLSHYLSYAEGRARDHDTATRIAALDPAIDGDDARRSASTASRGSRGARTCAPS
jgi:AmmeMemoRadiSam system protein B